MEYDDTSKSHVKKILKLLPGLHFHFKEKLYQSKNFFNPSSNLVFILNLKPF